MPSLSSMCAATWVRVGVRVRVRVRDRFRDRVGVGFRVRVNLGVRDVRGVGGDDAADVRHVAAVALGRHEAVDAAGLRAVRG